jgi:hypothetical protein
MIRIEFGTSAISTHLVYRNLTAVAFKEVDDNAHLFSASENEIDSSGL